MLINKLNDKWSKYIKIYEEFINGIPDNFKIILKKVRVDVGNPTNSFIKILDLEKYGLVKDVKIRLNVNFEKSDIVDYYSNINIFELLDFKKVKKLIDVPINIRDLSINIDKLISVISHEIRHVYDVYIINDDVDMKSFIKSLHLHRLRKDRIFNDEFENFLNLIYLSLEHELVARNTMIYENFINCNCDKEKLYNLFEKTYIYESLTMLKNFSSNNILNTDKNKLLENTNTFIEFFEEKTINIEDLDNYYKKWEEYFKTKFEKYLKEAYKVLDDIDNNIIKEKFHPIKYPSYKECSNIKEILKNIHINYILKK